MEKPWLTVTLELMPDVTGGGARPNPEHLLRTLAALSKTKASHRITNVVGDSGDFVEQSGSLSRSGFFRNGVVDDSRDPETASVPWTDGLAALMSLDALHDHERILRLGWLWFSGTVKENGEEVEYLFPAVSLPVHVRRLPSSLGEPFLEAVGDMEMTPLIADGALRERLGADVKMGGGALASNLITGARPQNRLLERLPELRKWSKAVSDGVGLSVDNHVIAAPQNPLYRRTHPGIVAYYMFAMYVDRDAAAFDRSDALNQLAALPGLDDTAFTKLYWPGSQRKSRQVTVRPASRKVRPLSQRQVAVLESVRASPPVATITGAPGNGKSHVVASLAMDAVAEGRSVLVVGSSPHAVDVLVEHFERTPGAVPVAFGGSIHGNRLADELLELRSRVEQYAATTTEANEFEQLRSMVLDLVGYESDAARFAVDAVTRLQLTEALDRAGDLAQLAELVNDAATGGVRGVLGRRHRSEVARRLGLEHFDADLALAEFARVRRADAARRLALVDGLGLDPSLGTLAAKEAANFVHNGRVIARQRVVYRAVVADHIAGQVAMALRSNRSVRRNMLGTIATTGLTQAVPLWIGMAGDVADVLPETAGLFDLVIIDEAAQLDQVSAAHALVRAKELVACGDNNQLGFVSHLADEEVAAASDRFGLQISIDPHRQSVLDLASAAGPTYQLTEHFRSAPHLIEFSARRFYGSKVDVVTRCPKNEAADHIEVQLLEGATRSVAEPRINEREVAEVMRLLKQAIDLGWRSVGLLSPFRAQADAIEAAIVATYRPEEIIKYGIRSGTVHAFQGDERDLMILSWAIGADEGEGPWRFVNQRDLLNVMVTRARHHVMVVTSVGKPPGLAGEYLQWAEPLENLIDDVGSADPWVNQVAEACRDAGIPTRVGYVVGPHTIDVVLGTKDQAIAVDCLPHSSGPHAHLDRALTIRRSGWRTADAYQSRWHDRLGELALQFARQLEK